MVVDALDAEAVERAVRAASPTHVIHQLTALPKGGPRRARDLTATNRLRIDGTRNLLRAAIAAGTKRFIGGSFALLGTAPTTLRTDAGVREAAAAVQSMESQILDAARAGAIEGIVLRYGVFYGPGNPGTEQMMALVRRRRLPTIRHDHGHLPFIHVEDAVSATLAALDRGPSGSVYDIVDDRPASFSEVVREMAAAAGAPPPFAVPRWVIRLAMPYMAGMLSLRVSLSNAKAHAELDWRPIFPSYGEGLRHTLQYAA
jgi:nucleoside-diphosphate-sugar epimerase